MDTVTVVCRQTEKAPVSASVSVAAPATVSVGGTPTFDFYGADGTQIATAQAVTDWTRTSGQTVQTWIDLDTNSPPWGGSALAIGRYRLVFKVPVLGSDGIARVRRPSVILDIRA